MVAVSNSRAWVAAGVLAACASPSVSQSQQHVVPNGAKIEMSGFSTIASAPASPFPDALPPPDVRPKDERGYYAQLAEISDAEAAKRMREQQQSRPAFEKLLATLRRREAGNFTDARLVHKPDWAYVLYFKRDPQRTLAKYIKRPHFKAAQARYGTADLQAIAKPWVERFGAHRLLGGYGTDATFGEVRMDIVVSEPEFRVIAAREGWVLPNAIKLEFSGGVEGPSVAPGLQSLVRIFPQSDRALGPTNQALLGGRIVLQDGCFYVSGPTKPQRLAYFAREVALGADAQGYLSLRSRGPNPRHLGRVGEQFSWGGPIGITEDAPMVAELRKRCGNAPLEHVGVPESARLSHVRPWVIDAIAEHRKISRDEAWRRFKACMEERETMRRFFDCDTL
jgi:hypothetical protein